MSLYDDLDDDLVLSDDDLGDILGDDLDGVDEDVLDGVGDYLRLDDDQLDGIIGDLGKPNKSRRRAKKAKKIKRVARRKGISPQKVLKAAKKKKARRSQLKMSTGSITCSPAPGCSALTAIRQVMYDTETLAATQAAGDVAFFSVIRGQTTNVSGSSVTKAEYHTNMTASKSLPNPQMFDLEGISMCVNSTNGASVQQLGNLRKNCSVVLYLGATPHLTLQLADLPMYSPLQGSFDGTQGVTPTNLGWIQAAKEWYDCRTLNPRTGAWSPIRINAQEVFWVNLKINSTLSMGAACDLVFRLHGTLHREIR